MKVRIVTAILDTSRLTLYKEDGSTIVLLQGDPRIRRIINETNEQIPRQGFADVDLSKNPEDPFHKFEKQSGVVRFFRIAKAMLRIVLNGELGSKPATPTLNAPAVPVAEPVEAAEAAATTVNTAVARKVTPTMLNEIMAHAKPTSDPLFHEERGLDVQGAIVHEGTGQTPNDCNVRYSSTDTIIAVKDDHVISGMERIKSQFAAAAKSENVKGMQNFLQRVGAIIQDREHSVDDLLKFLGRGDLPIADDGSILIYKVLRQADANMQGQYPLAQYVDCHTGKVPQWVGSKVMMDPKLVDHNRSVDCSNGLHVARRGYISSFTGDVCVLARLDPEDVIAVPRYNANKMRVCGYHILAELSPEQYGLLRQNKAITSLESGQVLLAQALAGVLNPVVTHTVEITAQWGGGIRVNLVDPRIQPKAPKASENELVAEALPDNQLLPDAPINPVEVAKQVAPVSRKEQVADLVSQINAGADNPQKQLDLWKQLEEIKRSARVSWERLNVPADLVAAMTPAPSTSPEPETVEATPADQTHLINENSYRNRIAKLTSITPISVDTAHAILDLKRKSKKSWETLGVPSKTVDRVLKLTSA